MSFFPTIGVVNKYLLGDTVLLEPIADELSLSAKAYIISNYPELFEAHPTVQGALSLSQLPPSSCLLDLSKSIKSIEGEGDDRHVVGDKFLNMCKEAGFSRRLRAPKLYLLASEWSEVMTIKNWFDRPCIGVCLGSLHLSKNWVYVIPAIKKMVKNGWEVFVFASSIDKLTRWQMPSGIHYIKGKLPLRDLMKQVAMMDVMLGPDTGIMHIAGALGLPIAVICFEYFTDLYYHYDSEMFASNNFTLEAGIRGVAMKPVISAISDMIDEKVNVNITGTVSKKKIEHQSHAFVRIRGLGDILMSLPAIATMRNENGNREHFKYTYIASKPGAKLLECTDLFDEVIGVDYAHATSGLPLVPQDIDYDEFTTIHNMINKIDFVPESDHIRRTDLFARELHVNNVNYDNDSWKIKIPDKWKEDAWKLLEDYGVNRDDRIIALQVDTKGLSRSWPRARSKEFAGLAAKKGYKVVLLSDKMYGGYPKHSINLTGQISLEEFVGIIAIATIGVSPDSSLLHIAGCMNKPAIGLFGAIDPKLRIAHYSSVHAIVGKAPCVPCNDWMKAICKDKSKWPMCMWSISAKKVLLEVQKTIGQCEKRDGMKNAGGV